VSAAVRRLAAAGAVAAALLAVGCGSAPDLRHVHGPLLRVYSSQPLVGPLADQGRDMVRAEQLALTEVRDRLGRWRIAYSALNNASPETGRWDPGVVSANARRAVQDPTTIAYLGEMDTGASAVSIPILNDREILQASPTDGVASFTRLRGGAPGEPDKYYPSDHRNFLRLVPADDLQAAALLQVMREAGVRRLYVLDDEGLYGERLGLAVARGAPAAGILLVKTRAIDPRTADPADVAADASTAGVDALLWAGGLSDSVPPLLDAVHTAAPGMRLFGPSALADAAFAAHLGPAAPRIRLVAPWPPLRAMPYAQDFARRFRARYGADPAPTAVYGYEAMRVVLAAIRRAGEKGNDRPAVTRAAFAPPPPGSPLGPYSIDPRGDTSQRTFAAYAVRGRRLAFLHTVTP
jgi:branched-chain amino acid transport system substrate-binding protein